MPSCQSPSVRKAALGLVVLALLGLTGCRSQLLITPSPIYSPLDADHNRQAILRGLAAHRWQVVSDEPGRIVARFDKRNVGKHVATVDVLYGDDAIEIRYRDSHGLRCNQVDGRCETIHRAYNRWVVQLSRDIEYGVQMVQREQARPAVGAGPE